MRERGWEIFITIVIVALVMITIVGGYQHCQKKEKCEQNGGAYERYNCRWRSDVTVNPNGTSTVNTYEVCDYRCVGARAEDGR